MVDELTITLIVNIQRALVVAPEHQLDRGQEAAI